MAQHDIKQVRGATQGSILFLGTNSIVTENNNKLNWDENISRFNILGSLKLSDGTEANNYIMISDANGVGSWTSSSSLGLGIYGGSGTILTSTIATLTDDLTFSGGEIKIIGGSINDNDYVIYTENSDNKRLTTIDNTGRVLLGLNDIGGTHSFGTSSVNIKVGSSNGSISITNANTDGTNNTTADNQSLSFTTRDSAGSIKKVSDIWVRNRNITSGSSYGVMVIGGAIQTENSDGISSRTIVSTRNRHTYGVASGVFHVENRDDSDSSTTMLIDSFDQNTQVALGVRSGSLGTSADTWNWQLLNNHKFTHNIAQLSTGDFIIKGQSDSNLFYVDASADNIGIGGLANSLHKLQVIKGGGSILTSLPSGSYIQNNILVNNTSQLSTGAVGVGFLGDQTTGNKNQVIGQLGIASWNQTVTPNINLTNETSLVGVIGFARVVGNGATMSPSATTAGISSLISAVTSDVTITNGYGVKIGVNGGTGTILNYKGLYVEDMSSKTGVPPVSSRFGIYIADPGYNYIAGRLGIGTSNPSSMLDVVGSFEYKDGNQSLGHILTSDGIGVSSWVSPSTLGLGSVNKESDTSTYSAGVTASVVHNLDTNDVIVQCYDSTGFQIIPDTIEVTGTGSVDLVFSQNLTSVKTVIMG